jgi:tetratricopeptide (TPR) repeat protein
LEKKNEAVKAKGEEPDLEAVSVMEEELEVTEDVLASRIAAKESFIEKYLFTLDQFGDDTEYLGRLIGEEESVNETFRKLIKGSQWEWDRDRMVSELEMVYNNGLDLAGYVLGRINQIEGGLNRASAYLDGLVESEIVLDDAPFAVFQNSLWLGDNEKRSDMYMVYSDEIMAFGDYLYDLVDYLDYLKLDDDEIFGFLSEDPAKSISKISEEFAGIKTNLREVQKKVQINIKNIHEMLKEKMFQGFYRLSEQTYLIRNELGDFYQNDKMFPEAIDQYEQVLAIDPWNLSAKYKLGLVYHWNGNWAKALALYNEVYQEDPVFGNVTSFYNELARQHADYLNFTGTTFADTSKLSFLASAEYRRNINGIFSVVTDYSVEETTLFDGGTSNRKHSLSVGLPIDLTLFTIAPSAGIYMTSNDSFGPDNDPLNYLGSYDYKFKGGASISTSIGPVIVDGAYTFDWENDTLMFGISPRSYHQGEAAAQLDFSFTKKPVIEDTSLRLSGYGKYMDDDNLIWGSFFELINSNMITSKPDIFLDIMGNFSYEDSSGVGSSYWSPDGVLAAGGGLELLTSFMAGEESYVHNRIRFASGYYLDGDTSGVSFEIGDTLRYERKEFSGYFRVLASFKNQTTPVSDPMNYWSLTFELGGRASLPDLLSL